MTKTTKWVCFGVGAFVVYKVVENMRLMNAGSPGNPIKPVVNSNGAVGQFTGAPVFTSGNLRIFKPVG